MVNNLLKRSFYRLKLSQLQRLIPSSLRSWITFGCLFFVGYTVHLNGEQLVKIDLSRLTIGWLLVAIGISFLSLLINAIAWRTLIEWLGYRSSKVDLIALFLSSNLLKYLPGGIWHFVDRLRVLKNHLGVGKALASVLLEPLLMAAAALLLVAFGGWQSGIGILCFIPSLCFTKHIREPILRKLEQIKANQLEQIYYETQFVDERNNMAIGRDDYPFKVLLQEMLFVFLRFGGFWCCLNAFPLDESISFLVWLSAFSLAWTIGLLVPAAPGGIGVFEAALLIRVGSVVPEANFLASLLCYRLISILVDLLAALGVSIRRIFMLKRINL